MPVPHNDRENTVARIRQAERDQRHVHAAIDWLTALGFTLPEQAKVFGYNLTEGQSADSFCGYILMFEAASVDVAKRVSLVNRLKKHLDDIYRGDIGKARPVLTEAKFPSFGVHTAKMMMVSGDLAVLSNVLDAIEHMDD